MANEEIKEFQLLEEANRRDPDILHAIEMQLEIILSPNKVVKNRVEWLLYRNLFRVRNARHMKIRKPRIFLGMISYSDYPNFQIYPFLNFADAISCCSPQSFTGRADRLSFDYNAEDFDDLRAKIPEGFEPDFYWDPQICGGSVPPYGLNNAPFPTVAGICHTFRGPHAETIANYYDYVTPISTPFCEIFDKSDISAKVLDIPVGGNWGSFENTIWPDPSYKRSIDVLLNFSPSEFPEYGNYRKQVHRLCTGFKEKYGNKFNIVVEFGVNKLQYLDSMKKARVVLNACGYNGPYNYRTFEAINSGALLMQIETDFPVEQGLGDYLQAGIDYIEFSEQNFESQLLAILEDEETRLQMSINALQKINGSYSYDNCQNILFNLLNSESPGEYKVRRKDDLQCFITWMKNLATSPVHYRHKRDLFARMAINSGLDDPDSIRLTMMALPILTRTQHGSSYINDIELKMMFEQSVMKTIDHLYHMLPGQAIRFTDKWFYLCCQAIFGSTDVIAIESLIAESQLNESKMPQLVSIHDQILFDLDIEDNGFVTLKKGTLDMPYMTYLHDKEHTSGLLVEYLQKSLMYFHRLAVIKLRHNGAGSNDNNIGFRRRLRA